jgi:hypothetical protein
MKSDKENAKNIFIVKKEPEPYVDEIIDMNYTTTKSN